MERIAIFAVVLVFAWSCNKKCECPVPKQEEKQVTEKDTLTSLLTAHSWKLVDYYIGTSSYYYNCNKDDVNTYKTNGDLIEDDGNNVCDISSKSVRLYSWKMLNNTKFIENYTLSNDTMTVTYISDTQLILKHRGIDEIITRKFIK